MGKKNRRKGASAKGKTGASEFRLPPEETKKVPTPAPSACRECGEVHHIPRYEFFKANRPRCARCGGTLEYGGTWRRTR